jgi:hypothetical protein
MPRSSHAILGQSEGRTHGHEWHRSRQKHLNQETVSRICSLSGQSRNPKGLPGGDCWAGLHRTDEKGEWGLALGAQAQLSLIDLVGMSFFPQYSVVGPLVFFRSLLLMVWGSLWLIVMIFFRVTIIVRYRGCRVWVLTAFWGTLFQLAVSRFNWIDKVMEDVARWVGKMLDNETGWEPDGEEADEPNLEGLRKKYPWWLAGYEDKELAKSPEKADLDFDDTVTLFEGKNTRMWRRGRHHQGECPGRRWPRLLMSSM